MILKPLWQHLLFQRFVYLLAILYVLERAMGYFTLMSPDTKFEAFSFSSFSFTFKTTVPTQQTFEI